jgi:hypothetical protein
MEPKLAAKYRHFTMVPPRDTKIVRPRAIPYGAYDENTLSLVLAMVGLALMVEMVVSMLVAFSVL